MKWLNLMIPKFVKDSEYYWKEKWWIERLLLLEHFTFNRKIVTLDVDFLETTEHIGFTLHPESTKMYHDFKRGLLMERKEERYYLIHS